MVRRSSLVGLTAAGVAIGLLFSVRPTADAQPVAGRGQCVGISTQRFGNDGLRFRVYRAFQDGTVEVTDDPCADFSAGRKLFGKWEKVGTP